MPLDTRTTAGSPTTTRDSSTESVDTPERLALLQLVAEGGSWLQHRVLGTVAAGGRAFPLDLITLGTAPADAPAVGFFGGVHGLERIGSEVVVAFLRSLVGRLAWDVSLHRLLETVHVVFMPMVNPGGLWRGTRANPNGVDLMRNAPVDATEPVPFLVGGQRLGASLPWYRGAEGAPMEAESAALCGVVQAELLSRPFSLAVDCHSGFGLADRIWFPYAHTRRPIDHLAELHALWKIFDGSQLHHPYVFEPQSLHYLAHGDLWDHLYQVGLEQPGRVFLPLTLEMGSWLWVKKNPRQMFSRLGIFNPLIAHRQHRVLRRHLGWFDFLLRAAEGHAGWLPSGAERERRHAWALRQWYDRGAAA